MRVVVSAILAVVTAGCAIGGVGIESGDESPRLRALGQSGEGSWGISMPHTVEDRPYSFGGPVLCLNRPGTAVITGVSAERPSGGMRIDAFAIRPDPTEVGGIGFGADRVDLITAGFEPGRPALISAVCDRQPGLAAGRKPATDQAVAQHSVELGLQYSRHGVAPAIASGVIVTYRSGSKLRHLRIPFVVALCPGQSGDDGGGGGGDRDGYDGPGCAAG